MNELPTSWSLSPLSDFCDRVVDGSHAPPKAVAVGLPMLSARNIQNRKINFDEFRFISEEDFSVEHKRTSIEPGDVLLTIVGTIGRTAVVPKEINPFTLQRSVAVLKSKFINPYYFCYALESPELQKYLFDNAKGTAQKGVYLKALSQVEIPIAPLNEQKRIADKLDRLLAKVDNCRERLDRIPLILKHFRQSVLAAATSGELTEDWRDANGYSQKSEWREYLTGELMITKPRNGYSPKAVEFATSTKSLTLTATTSGKFKPQYFKYIDELIPHNSHLWLEPKDILIQRANTLEYVGVSAIYFGAPHTFIYPDLMMKCKANNHVLTEFLHYLLSSNEVRSYFREHATGTAGNMPKINQQTVISAPVSVPPIQEQQEIVLRVEKLFDFADQLEARYKKACEYIDKLTPALLDKAFKGELVHQDPTDETAAVLLEKIQQARSNPENHPPKQPKTPRKPPSPKVTMLNRNNIESSHLTNILKNHGTITAETLWNFSKLSIDDFYDQLKDEELQGLLKEIKEETSDSLRLLEAI